MHNRKPSHAPILFLAPTLLAGVLLLLLPLPAPAAGSVEDYLSASAAGDLGTKKIKNQGQVNLFLFSRDCAFAWRRSFMDFLPMQ